MTDWSQADWVDPDRNWTPKRVPEHPPRVLIDFATRCNLRCPMCTVWGNEEASESVQGLMPEEKIDPLIKELGAGKPLIQPNMWGEPLLIPKMQERFRAMKAQGITISLNTNGLTLTREVAQSLVEVGVDSVFFSIDAVKPETFVKIRGIDRLHRVEAAVFRLLSARGNALTPRVGVTFTVQDGNRDEEHAFIDRWTGVVDCVRTGLVFEGNHFPGLEPPAVRTPCPTLYNTIPVHNDGTVTVCCLDGLKKTNMGNVFTDGVDGAWHSEAFAKVRYFHETGQWDAVPFCKPCNGWAQYDYEEEERDGLLIRRSPQMTYYNRIDRMENWQGSLRAGHDATRNKE